MRVPNQAQAPRPDPSVPNQVLKDEVRHDSTNLLPGDTSFELSAGEYVVGCGGRGNLTQPRSGQSHSRRVTTLAVHGRSAMRLSPITSESEHVIYWPAVTVRPDKAYVLSAFVRADSDAASVRLVSHCPDRGVHGAIHGPGRRWTRCHFSFKTGSGNGDIGTIRLSPGLVISLSSDRHVEPGSTAHWVEVDAIQLEEGAEPGPYWPSSAVDCIVVARGLSSNGCLIEGRHISYDCEIRNNTRQPIRARATWQLSDILGGIPRAKSMTSDLAPGKTHPMALDFGPARRGYYVLNTNVRFGVGQDLSRQTELIVTDAPITNGVEVGPFLGLFDADGMTSATRQTSLKSRPAPRLTGKGSPRTITFRWRDIETSPGCDDLASVNQAVDAIVADYCRPVVCLAGPMPGHAPSWAVSTHRDGQVDVDGRQYRQFVFRVVSHLRGRVRFWLLPPAPRERLVSWAQIYRQAAKLADAGARLIGPVPPASRRGQLAEIRRFIAEGGGAEIDVLAHDLFASTATASADAWERLSGDLAAVRRICAAAGLADMPRWELTGAWPDMTDDPTKRVARIHRAALLLKKHDVEHWLVPTRKSPTPWMRQTCSVEDMACEALARRLGPAKFEREQVIGTGVTANLFDGPTGPFAALIPTGSGLEAIRISLPADLRVENALGRTLAVSASSGGIPLSSAPIYVIPVGERANWLRGIGVSPTNR